MRIKDMRMIRIAPISQRRCWHVLLSAEGWDDVEIVTVANRDGERRSSAYGWRLIQYAAYTGSVPAYSLGTTIRLNGSVAINTIILSQDDFIYNKGD